MLKNSNELVREHNIEVDVCIMGAGVAGITLANELKDGGKTIALLDSGGEEHDESAQSYASANNVSWPYADPKSTRLRRLGGTSNHWANNTSPLSPIDFEKREGIPGGGWPINFNELSPYYRKAAVYCGTGDDGYDLSYWHEKFGSQPMIPIGDGDVELAIAKAAVPPVRFFKSHGQALVDSNNVNIYTFANVVDADFNPVTEKLISITFSNSSGEKHKVFASEFIMSFGGIENARMLKFFNAKNNNKLGDKFDNVGRYFMDHPTMRAAQIYTSSPDLFSLFEGAMTPDYKRFVLNFMQLSEKALLENEVTNIRMPISKSNRYDMSMGISSFHTLRQKLAGEDIASTVGKHITNMVMDIDMVAEAVSRKSFDMKLFESANDFSGYEVPLMMEQTPNRDNRVYLSNKKDRNGIPMLNIDWEIKEDDKLRLWKTLAVVGRGLGAKNIGRVRSMKERANRLFGDQVGFGHHHMGTTRMAENEKGGVVNSEQLVFGTKNLSIAGCSVFATGGHVPPTLTIAATSIRLAEIINKKL